MSSSNGNLDPPGEKLNVPEKDKPEPPIPEHPEVNVEAENPDDSERFSDYDSIASSTTSIGSSVYNYTYENGRRYHSYKDDKSYLLPNDDTEKDRLDLTHHLFCLTLDGELCLTKLENPERILDVGTGTGIWAIDMGDAYPNAEIIGTDLSPSFSQWVPSNVTFQLDDCRDEWTFPKDHFDFIHIRTLAGAISDWPALLKQCYTHLKPGGKLEVAEGRANQWWAHDSVPEDSYTYKWLMEWRRLSVALQFDVFPKLQGMAEALPFSNVKSTEKLAPMSPWPKDKRLKEIGRVMMIQYLEMGLEAYTLALFTRFGGWEETELKVLISKVKEEAKTMKMHLYTFMSYLTAQKPLDAPAVE